MLIQVSRTKYQESSIKNQDKRINNKNKIGILIISIMNLGSWLLNQKRFLALESKK